MEDKAFGVLSFNHGWTKQEDLVWRGNCYRVSIRTSSYKEQEPTIAQQNSYRSFENNFGRLEQEVNVRIAQYLIKDEEVEVPNSLEATVNALGQLLIPSEVLFFQDGSYAIEFTVDWTDDCICALVENDHVKIGYGAELLGSRI